MWWDVRAHVRARALPEREYPLFLPRIPISRAFPRDFAPCKRARKDNVPPGTVLRHRRDRENCFALLRVGQRLGREGEKRKRRNPKRTTAVRRFGRNARVKDGDRFIILGEGVGKWDGISETFVRWRRKEEGEERLRWEIVW